MPEQQSAQPVRKLAPKSTLQYRVSLPYQPEMVIQAATPDEAVELYNDQNGILYSDFEHAVVQLT